MNRLSRRIALVTGGLGGLGSATARLFAEEGATVIATDLPPQDAELASAMPPGVTYRTLDVTDETAWSTLAEILRGDYGRLDVLVHAAGTAVSRPLLETSLEEFQRVQRINTTGTFLGIRTVAPLMRLAGGGSIVTLSSVNGMQGATGLASYVTSKFAVRGLTKVAALELAEAGIRVNAICPGSIATPITDSPDFAGVDWATYTAAIPLGRRGEPADVAELALYLASDASGYVTGTEVVVDGGVTAGRRFPRNG
jgi:NAD(P)-dependent dehydrogenase (short-subunit alcohol dehydrogenase family)